MGRIPCRHNDNGSRKNHVSRAKVKMKMNRDCEESNAAREGLLEGRGPCGREGEQRGANANSGNVKMMETKVRMRRATLEVNEEREQKAWPVHGQGIREATE